MAKIREVKSSGGQVKSSNLKAKKAESKEAAQEAMQDAGPKNPMAGRLSVLDCVLLGLMWMNVAEAPYTKVEESFNIQAMHDILFHRMKFDKYDHHEFPGVVPRTFLGAISVAYVSQPLVALFEIMGLAKISSQYTVRLALGGIVMWTYLALRRQIARTFGKGVASAFIVVSLAQFHLPFYASRPLPNTFALALVNFAYAAWLDKRGGSALAYLVAATVIFRCDLVLLLGPICLQLLLSRTVSLPKALLVCAIAGALSLALTVGVDSFLWGRRTWPEGEVFWFNTVLNKSSEWGVAPWHWYFSSALPRALLGALPLALVGLFFERRLLHFFIPILTFVSLYSYLPHKELRFIFPALPIFNLAAACGVARVWNNRNKWSWQVPVFVMGALLAGSAVGVMVFAEAASANYPGGHAFRALHDREVPFVKPAAEGEEPAPVSVHIGTLAAMTGVTRFGEERPPWIYSKEENIPLEELAARNFTFLLSEVPEVPGYVCGEVVSGFNGWRLDWASLPPLKLVMAPKVFIQLATAREEDVGEGKRWPGCQLIKDEPKDVEL